MARNFQHPTCLKSVGYGENEQACMTNTRSIEHAFGHGVSTKSGDSPYAQPFCEARITLHDREGDACAFENRSDHAADAAIAYDYDMIALRVPRAVFACGAIVAARYA